jgi:DNA polymerase I-like protein with 3'-5' exonuclease and polymerase domains
LHGWQFLESDGQRLLSELSKELEIIVERCRERHPFVPLTEFTPKRDNSTKGYHKDMPFTKITEFNPASRTHIAWVMGEHNQWTPTTFTDKGAPTIDETVLKDIGSDECLDYFRVLELTKMIGTLSQGVNSWLRLVHTNGRIHHHCSLATVTSRMAHRKPNLGQTPSDSRFRRLFVPSRNMVMVGADLSGVELRVLSHYLSRYDGGEYAKVLLNDDIHQVNADKIGISRSAVKTVTYAMIYGAGDAKIGFSYNPLLSEKEARAKGKEIRAAYLAAIPALGQLIKDVRKAADARGYIKSIDGRQIPCDQSFRALNYLLQSTAAVLAKRWMVIAHNHVNTQKIPAHQLGFIHDELQWECPSSYADKLSELLVTSATEAGEYHNLRIRIDAEAKTGQSWADTH